MTAPLPALWQDSPASRSWLLFLQERRRLLAYIKRLAPVGCDGVDILQEVGLRLLRRPDAEVSGDGLTAWCKAVARHIVLHELRAARYERVKLAALGAAPRPDAWESERLAALRSTLMGALERMDPLSRELLLRRYLLEQTSNEIARELHMSSAAVRMRLMRIREELGAGSEAGDLDAPPSSRSRMKLRP